jgi:hypothetical protein
MIHFSALFGLLRVSYIEFLSSVELEFPDGTPRQLEGLPAPFPGHLPRGPLSGDV